MLLGVRTKAVNMQAGTPLHPKQNKILSGQTAELKLN